MANLSYGDMVTELKGKSNNRVYQKTRSGYVQRRLVKPHNPNSLQQQATRKSMAALNQQWKGLTEAERLAWYAAATGSRSGSQEYVSTNFKNSFYNMTLVSDPGASPFPDSVGDPGIKAHAGTISVQWSIVIFGPPVVLTVEWDGVTPTIYPLATSFDISHTYAPFGNADVPIVASDNRFPWSFSSNHGNSLNNYQPGTIPAMSLNLSGEKFSTATVNAILSGYATSGFYNGYLNLSLQSPSAPPSGAGITAKAVLISKGWVVLTD